MVRIIVNCIILVFAIVFSIFNIITPNLTFIFITVISWIIAISLWFLYIYSYLALKRERLFKERMDKLDRTQKKYQKLFIIYDFINGEEYNLEVVKSAMKDVYFYPSLIISHPEKANKKSLIAYLIEYYLSLGEERLERNFFWNYNENYFTWGIITVFTIIGTGGIITLSICYNTIPNPNIVLYTTLYFLFGAFEIPLLAKFFGHFI